MTHVVARITAHTGSGWHLDNIKKEAQLKIEKEKQEELDEQIFLQGKKDYQADKCPDCGEKIDQRFSKCFACGADLSVFE